MRSPERAAIDEYLRVHGRSPIAAVFLHARPHVDPAKAMRVRALKNGPAKRPLQVSQMVLSGQQMVVRYALDNGVRKGTIVRYEDNTVDLRSNLSTGNGADSPQERQQDTTRK